jgi:hypothetical protein
LIVGDPSPYRDFSVRWASATNFGSRFRAGRVCQHSCHFLAATESHLTTGINEDLVGRTAETLWTEVVRDAYQHAAGQGYVEQPHSRAYRWIGSEDTG